MQLKSMEDEFEHAQKNWNEERSKRYFQISFFQNVILLDPTQKKSASVKLRWRIWKFNWKKRNDGTSF